MQDATQTQRFPNTTLSLKLPPISFFDIISSTQTNGISGMSLRNNVISAYIPEGKRDQKPLERLARLAKKRNRSINFLIITAIFEYLEREENKLRKLGIKP